MAAIVCPGLQSHLESQHVESRTLRLRLPSSKPLPSQPVDLAFKSCFWDSNIKTHHEENSNKADTTRDNPISTNPSMGDWSFLEALSNVSQGTKEPLQKETTYVLPQAKRSSLLLSLRSLELCTENLGNESGTDIIENGIDMLSSSLECDGGNLPTREQTKPSQLLAAKKAKTQNFPPPLTTMRGADSLVVRPHREDGRLVIEVTKVPPSASCFQAERSHGRLRLCFLKNYTPSFDPEEDEPTNEGLEEEFESEVNEQVHDVEEEEEEEEEDEEEAEEEEDDEEEGESERDACRCEEIEIKMKGKSSNVVGGDMIIENYERPRRCKEGDHENNEFLNWGEPLWVATS